MNAFLMALKHFYYDKSKCCAKSERQNMFGSIKSYYFYWNVAMVWVSN